MVGFSLPTSPAAMIQFVAGRSPASPPEEAAPPADIVGGKHLFAVGAYSTARLMSLDLSVAKFSKTVRPRVRRNIMPSHWEGESSTLSCFPSSELAPEGLSAQLFPHPQGRDFKSSSNAVA